jgi:hypothetical protein
MPRYRSLFSSPRAPFFVSPSASEGSLGAYAPRDDRLEDVAPSHPPFCRPEGSARGVPRRLRTSGRQGGAVAPIPLFFVAPSFFYVTPNEVRDASLSLPFFVTPSASEGSPIVKEEISRYARNDKMSSGCLATLGKTKNGRSAGQSRGPFCITLRIALDRLKKKFILNS